MTDKNCVAEPMDVSIVVDSTKSVGKENFEKLKDFVQELIDFYDVRKDGTHISIMTYAKTPTIQNHLGDSKYYSKESLKKMVNDIPNQLGNPTRTDRALEAVRDDVFTAKNGDRPDVNNVMIVLTDGSTHKTSKPYEDITPGLDVSTKVRLQGVGWGWAMMRDVAIQKKKEGEAGRCDGHRNSNSKIL